MEATYNLSSVPYGIAMTIAPLIPHIPLLFKYAMTRLSVDVGAGSLPLLRAGFANIHLFFIAIVLWMMWQSVVHHDADPRSTDVDPPVAEIAYRPNGTTDRREVILGAGPGRVRQPSRC